MQITYLQDYVWNSDDLGETWIVSKSVLTTFFDGDTQCPSHKPGKTDTSQSCISMILHICNMYKIYIYIYRCMCVVYIQYIHIYYVKDLLIWVPKLPFTSFTRLDLLTVVCWTSQLWKGTRAKSCIINQAPRQPSTIVYRTSSSAISGETLPFLCACSELRDLCHQEFGPRSSMTISATARQHQTSTPQHAIPTQL